MPASVFARILRCCSPVLLLIALFVAPLAPPVRAQICSLPDPAGARPSPRYGHAMAYMGNGKILLFGGRDRSGKLLGDTWTWDGTRWTLVATTGPSPRCFHAMAYVSNGNHVLLYGGLTGSFYSTETWEWTGTTWTQPGNAGNPMVETGHVVLCDDAYGYTAPCPPHNGVGICYGVKALSMGTREWEESWGWATPDFPIGGARWYPRGAAARVPDGTSNGGIVVAFGGEDAPVVNNPVPVSNTTLCTFLPNNLVNINSGMVGNPGARRDHAMAYDGQGALMFGGDTGDGRTWRAVPSMSHTGSSWSGTTTWTVVATSGPGARQNLAMAYDPSRGKVVAFGGTHNGDVFGDTWEWDGSPGVTAWTEVACPCLDPHWVQQFPGTSPPAREAYYSAYDTFRHVWVLYGGIDTSGVIQNDTWEWNGSNWSLRATTGPGIRYGGAMAYDPSRNATILFGGFTSGSDTWQWNGTIWKQVATTGPAARGFPGMAYDPVLKAIVMFGGYNLSTSTYLNDSYAWNGTAWVSRAPSGPPSIRRPAAMVTDVAHNQILMFGGVNSGSALNDLWSWSSDKFGSYWTHLTPLGGSPSARVSAAMAWLPGRKALALFSGGGAADTWELAYSTVDAQWHWVADTLTVHPSARGNLGAAYDDVNDAMVVFGGDLGGTPPPVLHEDNQTWFFEANSVPELVSQTASATLCEGQPFTLRVTTRGGSPGADYAWRHDGALIPGATSATYTVASAALADAGNYTCDIGSSCGSFTSPAIPVQVNAATTFTSQPQSASVCPGSIVTFSVTTSGTPANGWQWRRNGQSIPGATASSYTINPVTTNDAGGYDCVVGSTCGQVFSAVATLEVGCVTVLARVNAGGPAVAPLDAGPVWAADTQASPSGLVNAAATGNTTSTYGATIDMTDPSVPPGTPASLFQSERWDAAGGSEMQWTIPASPGRYRVRLYFAEDYFTAAGQRSFDVTINGAIVLHNYDVFALVGGNKGRVETFNVGNAGSAITIGFAHGVQNPAIKAVEVARYEDQVVARVNAAGASLASTDGGPAWAGDLAASPSPNVNAAATGNTTSTTASTVTTSSATIPPGTPAALFQSNRWDNPGGPEMEWTFATGPGRFEVRLYLAEIYTGITGAGQRTFSVQANGATVLNNEDVFAEAGLNAGIVKTFFVSNAGSTLTIDFLHGVQNPIVNGIEILKLTNGVADAGPAAPLRTSLAQNAPNPFRSPTRIAFAVAHPSHVSLRVYDLAGRVVRTLLDGEMPAGEQHVAWDGTDGGGRRVAPGMYLYRLRAGDFTDTMRMVMLP